MAVVTGAGSGLGRALAVELAYAGATVVGVDVDAGGLARTVAITGEAGTRCLAKCADVSLYGDMERTAADVLDEFGRVDILVNNAGVGVGGELSQVPVEDFEWIVGINLMGEVHGTKAFLPSMIERGSGHVVNVASLSGLVPLPFHLPYTTTKYALTGFSEALSVELRKYGVWVTLVCPGAIRTNIIKNTRTPESGSQGQSDFKERFRGVIEDRGMQPEKAARKVLAGVEKGRFLCLVGAEAHLLYQFHRLAPGLMRRVVTAVAEKAT